MKKILDLIYIHHNSRIVACLLLFLIASQQGLCVEKEARSGFIFDRFPNVSLPSSARSLSQVSEAGDSIELEDGTIWKISSYDAHKVASWKTSDILSITQNTSWFSRYTYRIINQSTGASIEANVFFAPEKNKPHSLYISAIDHNRGIVILNDNTHWEIASLDGYKFSGWAIDDPIMIGINSGWNSSYEYILINVSVNQFAQSHQF